MEKGEKFGYFWLVSTNVFCNLKEPTIKHHIGHQIYIASLDHRLYPLTEVQKARGWTTLNNIMISPALYRSIEISFDFEHSVDWYISKKPLQFTKELEMYSECPGFTLAFPEYTYKDLVPTWEGLLHYLLPEQEKFWQQLKQIDPQTYLSHGDYDVILSKNREFMADVENIA